MCPCTRKESEGKSGLLCRRRNIRGNNSAVPANGLLHARCPAGSSSGAPGHSSNSLARRRRRARSLWARPDHPIDCATRQTGRHALLHPAPACAVALRLRCHSATSRNCPTTPPKADQPARRSSPQHRIGRAARPNRGSSLNPVLNPNCQLSLKPHLNHEEHEDREEEQRVIQITGFTFWVIV